MPRAKKRNVTPAAQPDSYVVRFGKQVRQRRLALDMTQAAFADKVRISLKYLGEIERGDGNPKGDMIGRIAAALDWNGFDPQPDAAATTALRDEFAKAGFPAALAEFFRTGGAGEVWDDYEDLAAGVWAAADAMVNARNASTRYPTREMVTRVAPSNSAKKGPRAVARPHDGPKRKA